MTALVVASASRDVPLRQGRNVWRLWRTDRDGASREQVIETVGPAVGYMVRPAGMGEGPWEIFRTDAGEGNPSWRIGAARPVEMTSLSRYRLGEPAPDMSVPSTAVALATREGYPGSTMPTVKGQVPWWVVVDVWWRKPDTTVPWPGFRVDWVGRRIRTVTDADWVLERAVWVPPAAEPKADPGDATSAERHGRRVTEVISQAALPVGLLALLALGIYSGALNDVLRNRR